MKVVLTIAGSDSSGGAGIQADLKTFEAFGVFGASVLTVLTAQNTKGVTDIFAVDKEFVKKQLEAVFDDFDVAAVKIGMLFSNQIIDVVREFVKGLSIPIVFDPVFISKAGSQLLNDDAIENMKTLLPYATIATPNLFEVKKLFEFDYSSDKNLENLLDAPCAVVTKNSVVTNDGKLKSVDILYENKQQHTIESPYIQTQSTHGTGCSFSSAIAANLALGNTLKDSVEIAKKFIYESIQAAPQIGGGKGPVAHKIGGQHVA